MKSLRWLVVGVLCVVAAAVLHGALTFEYAGPLGPPHWGELSPDWKACGSGTEQTPVDFARSAFSRYRYGFLTTRYGSTTGDIVNNGHTIQVDTSGRNTLALGDVQFELVQFHFHTPSEHTFEGRGYDMELHLVHRSADGTLAVIGIFLQRGTSSGALAPIFEHLPSRVDVRERLRDLFDPSTFLPRSKTHYRYMGSLTTPPCSEGVRWVVMADPMTISDEHMAEFAERVPFNSRPVQRLFR